MYFTKREILESLKSERFFGFKNQSGFKFQVKETEETTNPDYDFKKIISWSIYYTTPQKWYFIAEVKNDNLIKAIEENKIDYKVDKDQISYFLSV